MADNVGYTPGTGATVAADDVGGFLHQRVKLSLGADGAATDAKTIDADTGGGSDPTLGVVLVAPASGGGVAIGGDATNGLDVDVTRVVPGTGATNLGKAEDTAHADGDVGVLMLGVRNYAGAGTDGDYSALSVTSDGMLHASVHPQIVRIAVTSSGLTTSVTAYSIGDQVGAQMEFANAARVSGGSGYIVGAALISAADIIGAFDVVVTKASITLAADNAAYAISDADALHVVTLIPLSGAYDIGNNRIALANNIRIPFTCDATSLYAGLITRSAHTFFAATSDLVLVLFIEQA